MQSARGDRPSPGRFTTTRPPHPVGRACLVKSDYRGWYGAVAAPAGSLGQIVGMRPPHFERRFVRCIAEII